MRLGFAFLLLAGACALSVPQVRAEDDGFMNEELKPAKKPAKTKKKGKKEYDYDRSKYKSRVQTPPKSYKFNANGDPITPDAKKKSSAKAKKKSSEPPETWLDEGGEACGAEEACADKKSEADAL